MRVLISALALSLLAACGGSDQVYSAGMVPQNVTGDADKVSVFNVWSAGGAMPLAQRHCAQHGKTATFERMSGITAHFACT